MCKELPVRLPVTVAQYCGGKRGVRVVVKSLFGIEHEAVLDCTEEQYMRWYRDEDHVQRIFPLMDADMRELLVTGMGPVEWENHFAN